MRQLNQLGVTGIGDIGNLRYAELFQRPVDMERPALAGLGIILDSSIVHGGLGFGSRPHTQALEQKIPALPSYLVQAVMPRFYRRPNGCFPEIRYGTLRSISFATRRRCRRIGHGN